MNVVAQAITEAKKQAINYYGGNVEDANDMLLGIELVVRNICKILPPEDSKALKEQIKKCA